MVRTEFEFVVYCLQTGVKQFSLNLIQNVAPYIAAQVTIWLFSIQYKQRHNLNHRQVIFTDTKVFVLFWPIQQRITTSTKKVLSQFNGLFFFIPMLSSRRHNHRRWFRFISRYISKVSFSNSYLKLFNGTVCHWIAY